MARVPGYASLREVLFGTGTGRHRHRPPPRPWPDRAPQWASRIAGTFYLCWFAMLLAGYTGGWKLPVVAAGLTFSCLALLGTVLPWARGGPANGSGRADGRGLDGDGGPAPEAVRRWRVLWAVSRLMPRAAGRRWLAEAESTLFEMDAGQRPAAMRSYLRSAPRVLARAWARELTRRTRRRAG